MVLTGSNSIVVLVWGWKEAKFVEEGTKGFTDLPSVVEKDSLDSGVNISIGERLIVP
jgi:hypothetical protein